MKEQHVVVAINGKTVNAEISKEMPEQLAKELLKWHSKKLKELYIRLQKEGTI